MNRLDDGEPLREAMRAAGLSIIELSERTTQADPAGYGIKPSTVGHMVSTGPSGRERFATRSCDLVARALGKDLGELFTDGTT